MRPRIWTTLCALLLLLPPKADASGARSLAMGGAWLRSGDVLQPGWNPATHAVPPVDDQRVRRWPLPLGALQTLSDLPDSDPASAGFDALELARAMATDPWALDLGRATLPEIALEVGVVRGPLETDVSDLRDLLSEQGFDRGSHVRLLAWATSLDLGPRYGVLALTPAEGFLADRLGYQPTEELGALLRDGGPTTGASYDLLADAHFAAGFSSAISYAREIQLAGVGRRQKEPSDTQWLDDWWDRQDARPRLWIGAAVRRYTGLRLIDLHGDVDFTGLAPAANHDLDADYETVTTRAGYGGGWGVDLGAVARWRDLEIGVSGSDLLAELTWPHAERDRLSFEEGSGTVVHERISTDFRFRSKLESTKQVHAIWRADRTNAILQWRDRASGASLHGGVEVGIHPALDLRAGLERDAREQWQGSAGLGTRWGSLGLDLGIATHSRGLGFDRDVALGISVTALR